MSESNQNGSTIGKATVDRVLDTLKSTQRKSLISGVMSPPGSGKSTTLIRGIQQDLKDFFIDNEIENRSEEFKKFKNKRDRDAKITEIENKITAKIFVTEPTIPATTNLHRYMSNKYRDIRFGYAAESEIRYDDKSEIVYCTEGHIENKMLSYFEDGKIIGDIDFCDVLVFDEAHRKTLAMDIAFGLWLLAYKSKKIIQVGAETKEVQIAVPKIIFMSATLSMKEIDPKLENASVVTVEYKPYPVTIAYHDKKYDVDDNKLYEDTANILVDDHLLYPIKPKGVEQIENNRTVEYPGYDVWLVFCPGQREVLDTCKYIENNYDDELEFNDKQNDEEKKVIDKLEVIPVYGSMGSAGYSQIFTPPSIGTRRVIVTTNIAEASITLEYVSRIYDPGTEKYAGQTASGTPCLTLGRISRSSANQRAGRTGRLCPGFVLRMIPKVDFDLLPEQRASEAMRIPLHNVIIKIMSVGLDPELVFRDRIDQRNLERALITLIGLKMIANISDDEKVKVWRVENIGHFASMLPLSIHASAILYHWMLRKHDVFVGIVLTSLIGCFDESYFFYPNPGLKGKEQETAKEKELRAKEYFMEHFFKFGGKTHIETLILLWHHAMYALGTLRPKYRALRDWCLDNSINNRKFSEALSTISRLTNILYKQRERDLSTKNSSNIGEINIGAFSPRLAVENIVPILKIVYWDRQCIQSDRDYMSYKAARNEPPLKISTRTPMTSKEANAKNIIVLKANTGNKERGETTTTTEAKVSYINFYTPFPIDNYLPDDKEIDYTLEKQGKIDEEDEDEEDEEIIQEATGATFITGNATDKPSILKKGVRAEPKQRVKFEGLDNGSPQARTEKRPFPKLEGSPTRGGRGRNYREEKGSIFQTTSGREVVTTPVRGNRSESPSVSRIRKYSERISPRFEEIKRETTSMFERLTFLDAKREVSLPFNVRKIKHPKGFDMNLVDESNLFGGSKQRALIGLIPNIREKELVYYGTAFGYGQIAAAYCALLTGKSIRIYVDTLLKHKTALTEIAEQFKAKVIYLDDDKTDPISPNEKPYDYIMRKAISYMKGEEIGKKDFNEKDKNITSYNGKYLLPFGLDSKEIHELYVKAMEPLKVYKPKRVWVVAGSGVISRVLSRIWPDAEMMIVQVGRKIWPDQLEGIKHQLLVSPYKFPEEVKEEEIPPYESLLNYDAKVWPFILEQGKEGDYIWNTAGNPFGVDDINDEVSRISTLLDEAKKVKERIIEEAKTMDFPYIKEEMPLAEDMFNSLKREIEEMKDSSLVVRDYGLDYKDVDGISNHFTEEVRMKCVVNRSDRINPLEYWKKYNEVIAKEAYWLSYKNDEDKNEPDWHEAMHSLKCFECGTFNPFIMAVVIKKYFNKESIDVLDPSMGWGDRELCALAMDQVKSYVGFDPNTLLKECYKNIRKKFGADKECIFITNKYSNKLLPAKFAEKKFDLALTSPPFFDVEIYEGTERDLENSYNEWFENIYKPYILDMADAVKIGGIVALYVSDIFGVQSVATDSVKILNEYSLEQLETIKYRMDTTQINGLVSKGYERTMYVFRKLETSRRKTPTPVNRRTTPITEERTTPVRRNRSLSRKSLPARSPSVRKRQPSSPANNGSPVRRGANRRRGVSSSPVRRESPVRIRTINRNESPVREAPIKQVKTPPKSRVRNISPTRTIKPKESVKEEALDLNTLTEEIIPRRKAAKAPIMP